MAHPAPARGGVFYYALFSWRAHPAIAPGYEAFPYAEASGYGVMATLLMIILLAEGIPTHWLILRSRHPEAAFFATAFTIYALLWAIALARSVRLNPILVGEESILLRAGFLWQIEIARDNIAALRRLTGAQPNHRQPGYLRLVSINDPQFIVDLIRPVTARGPFGIKRTVSHIVIAVDQPDAFAAALASPSTHRPIKPAS